MGIIKKGKATRKEFVVNRDLSLLCEKKVERKILNIKKRGTRWGKRDSEFIITGHLLNNLEKVSRQEQR